MPGHPRCLTPKVKGGLGSVEKYHNITIVYTKEAETADAYTDGRPTRSGGSTGSVATSDGPEQIIILGHGALRLSASAFPRGNDGGPEADRRYSCGRITEECQQRRCGRR